MSNHCRTSFAASLVIWLCLFQVNVAQADPQSSRTQKATKNLQQIQQRIKALQVALEKDGDRKDDLTRQLRILERKIGKANNKLKQLRAQVAQQTDSIQALETSEKALEKSLQAQKNALAEQLRIAYVIGRQENLKLFLNQEDPTTYERVITYSEYLSDARAKQIASIEAKTLELQAVRTELVSERTRLLQLEGAQLSLVQSLENTRSDREQVISRIEKALTSKGQQLSRMHNDEKSLKALLRSLQNALDDIPVNIGNRKPFRRFRGSLRWPAKGKHTKRYGMKRALGQLRWRGTKIAAKLGAPVRAISYGRVTYAGWLPRLGLLIIIEHGDGYVSLYAHNQQLFKEVGEWVEAGDRVATVGDSGGQRKPGLYFEIRKGTRQLNPRRWCKLPALP